MPGSICARGAVRISLVEYGSRPGTMRGPMLPPSTTMTSCGARVFCASTAATRGTPTPANTEVTPASWRAATTARSSVSE